MPDILSLVSEQTHQSDPRVLNRRTLERDHPQLAARLGQGMAVLDAGCGTGAITAGIARRVGTGGRVIGVDRDASLLRIAREEHRGVHHLTFLEMDILASTFDCEFDVVTAARTLQWIADPGAAVRKMSAAAKPGVGLVVILDYNHEANLWHPEPPPEFVRFYRAFLAWRTAHGWDNRLGDRLPDLLRPAGLEAIEVHVTDETVCRGEPEFADAASIWTHVIQSLGPHMVTDGFLGEQERLAAESAYPSWVREAGQAQTHSMRTVIGRRPGRPAHSQFS